MALRQLQLTAVLIVLSGCGGKTNADDPQRTGTGGRSGGDGGAAASPAGRGGSSSEPVGGANTQGGTAGSAGKTGNAGSSGGAGAPQCEGAPQCDPGDTPIGAVCPPDTSCYARSLCGTTVYCIDDESAGGAAGNGAGGAGEIQCPIGFVICAQGEFQCVRTMPDTDGDGCCVCLRP